LKSKELHKATQAKSFLEQRQREEAKERAEKSLKWQTKVKEKFDFINMKNEIFYFILVFYCIG
jgi:ABC-type lipoprotein release transport system permease subunit